MYGSLMPGIRRICVVRRRHAGLHDYLDARVASVAERATRGWSIFETNPVRDDDEGRIDRAAFDALEQEGHVLIGVGGPPRAVFVLSG